MTDIESIKRINSYFDDYALMYEKVLCSIYGYAQKNSRHGATQEVYHGMLHDIAKNQKGEYITPFEAGLAIGEVCTLLYEAFDYGCQKYENNINIVNKLNECKRLLREPSLENIQNSIEEAYKLLL